SDGVARIWERESGTLLHVLPAGGTVIYSVAFSPDGRELATAARDGMVRVFHPGPGSAVAGVSGHRSAVTGIVLASDGRTLFTRARDATVRSWDTRTGVSFVLAGAGVP